MSGTRTGSVAAAVLLASFACAASAQQPALVRDIDPAYPGDLGSYFEEANAWGSIGRRVLFTAHQDSTGLELWVTEGTSASTQLLADTSPGPVSGLGELVAATPSLIYFRAPGGLWRTDGSRAGTYLLAAGVQLDALSGPHHALLGGVLFFTACDATTGCELWRTQGTPASTTLVKDIQPGIGGSNPHRFVPAGSGFFFLLYGGSFPTVWRSDGTASGTRKVFDAIPTTAIAAAGERVVFLADAQNGFELWAAGGTLPATLRIAHFDSPAPSRPEDLRTVGGFAYFLARDPQLGLELWRSDGTVPGTRRTTNLPAPEPFEFTLPPMLQVGAKFFFVALDEGGFSRLWTSAGTPESARSLSVGCAIESCPLVAPRTPLLALGQRLLFLGSTDAHGLQDRVWISDGTAAGTRPLVPSSAGESADLQVALGKAFFVQSSGAYQSGALWASDGTALGTKKLVSLDGTHRHGFRVVVAANLAYFASAGESRFFRTDGTPAGTELITIVGRNGRGSSPAAFADLGGTAIFVACLESRMRFWRSSGTSDSTVALSEPVPGPCAENLSYQAPSITISGGQAFVSERGPHARFVGVWRTDLSGSGTRLIRGEPNSGDNSEAMSVVNGASFLVETFGTVELWTSDGTAAGTAPVVTFPHDYFGPARPFGVNRFLFTLPAENQGVDHQELWISDGTAAGTKKLGLIPGNVQPVVFLAGVGYFLTQSFALTAQLWRTDGTEQGTFQVFAPAGNFGGPGGDAANLVLYAGSLLFSARGNGNAWAIWRSDGTAAGTARLVEVPTIVATSPFESPLTELTVAGGLLFFSSHGQTYGQELWVSDGSAAGTQLVVDAYSGPIGSAPHALRAFDGKLVFAASDVAHGTELWQSDGTAAGTRLVADLAPGPTSSNPREFTPVGGRLYFSADDNLHGRELWALAAGAGSACQPSDTTLCLRGGRFEVSALWRDFQGNSGPGHGVALTSDTGYFWFFDPANVETVLKVLDGRGLNNHHWAFYGALSNVEYAITVRDTDTGASRRYYNPPGNFASVGDTQAFGPLGANARTRPPSERPSTALVAAGAATGPKAACVPGPLRLCLNDSRFAVSASWKDFAGRTGAGQAVALTGDTGYFWFFDAANVEVVLKVLDGRPLNGKFWVLYGALSSVEYTLTVTDTATGTTRTYRNPSGRFASVGDTSAF